jgi:phage shock protein PspC (stress-responsive transcriptional regulator)
MNTFLRKISSRKLWTAIAGVVVGIAALFGANESEWTAVAGVVGSIASCIAYIVGESKIDAARAAREDVIEYTSTAETLVGSDDPEKE